MCAAGAEKVEARYAADHPATHRLPTAEECLAPDPAGLTTESRSREQKVPRFEREERFWSERNYPSLVLSVLDAGREEFTSAESMSLNISEFTILSHILTSVIV